jgi:hypothetical protein
VRLSPLLRTAAGVPPGWPVNRVQKKTEDG